MSEVSAAYDAWARTYDEMPNATRDLDARALRAQPLDLAAGVVLEVGCGTGKNTAWLAGRARRVLAADLSPGMLARARERVRAPAVSFLRFDLRAPWPLADGTVDAVVADLVLEHVPDVGPFFAEAARVLRAGGGAFVCELHPYRQLRGAQARFLDPERGEEVRVPAHRHEASDYVNAAVAAGMHVVRMEEWRDDQAGADDPPRLLSLRARRGAPPPGGSARRD